MSLDFEPGPVEASMRAKAVDARRRLYRGNLPPPKQIIHLAPPLSPFDPRRIAEEIARAIESHPPAPIPAWKSILVQTSNKYGLPIAVLVGVGRSKKLVAARNEAAYRMVMELGMSYPATGRRINRDHSTTIYAVRRHIETHPALQPIIEQKAEDEQALRHVLEDEVIRLYFDEEETPTAISQALDITRNTVHSVVRREVMRVRAERRAAA
ncbi:MAG: hypothetical protein JWR51_4648 [Devosia sp.]|uniref:helix-turn-helix domain-containing protein n=1 Tax=Devosia sp. TaxID=1871048 RepID=UPI002629FE81|nr:helix-turn-helix domain-containing protein [Devosia sp.]MDB5531545.1 hypothetical protein [Devosia sp.]